MVKDNYERVYYCNNLLLNRPHKHGGDNCSFARDCKVMFPSTKEADDERAEIQTEDELDRNDFLFTLPVSFFDIYERYTFERIAYIYILYIFLLVK